MTLRYTHEMKWQIINVSVIIWKVLPSWFYKATEIRTGIRYKVNAKKNFNRTSDISLVLFKINDCYVTMSYLLARKINWSDHDLRKNQNIYKNRFRFLNITLNMLKLFISKRLELMFLKIYCYSSSKRELFLTVRSLGLISA